MAYKFTLTEIIREYTHIKEEYGYVDVKKVYVCYNFDDLQNLFLTLVDFTEDDKTLKVEIKKETFDEEVME